MGDSTAMTIEFLRARLLSERSVSRTARQRADQLAKRVMELEAQLKIVTIQRKKAEKAAAEVLAILETQGIGELSEAIDSSSEREEVPCGEGCDDTPKEYESSATSRMERSQVEDGLSGSEPEVSPSQGRSLSWKSHSKSPDSHDKQRAKQIRQRQRRLSFMLTLQSSPKHNLGKSCCKIKRRDMRSAAKSETHKPTLLDAHGNGGFTCSNYCDDQHELSLKPSRGIMEETVADTSVSHYGNDHNEETEALPCDKGSGRDEEMERVLEQQAKFIGQFQAEENAQREWEEKYNENKTSTSAYYEPENQSYTAENRSQFKKELTEVAVRTPDYDEEAKLRTLHIPISEERAAESLSSSEKHNKEASSVAVSNDFVHKDPNLITAPGSCSNAWRNDLVCQPYDGISVNDTTTISHEFAFAAREHSGLIRNGNQIEIIVHDDSKTGNPSNSTLHPHGHSVINNPSLEINSPFDDGSKLSNLGPTRNQMPLQRQLSQAPSSSLGGVLEALQRAKLSLRQELSKLPSPSQDTVAIAAPTTSQNSTIASGDGLDIPIGSATLFRLPAESLPQPQFTEPIFYGTGLSLTASRPDVGYSASSYGYQNPTTTYVGAGSRVILGNEYFDNYFTSSMGLPESSKYSRTYSDSSAGRPPFRSEFSKSYSDVRIGMPPWR